MARTRQQLWGIGVKVDDILYKQASLHSLSSIFHSLVVALDMQIDLLSIEELHAQAFLEKLRQSMTVHIEAKALHIQPSGCNAR